MFRIYIYLCENFICAHYAIGFAMFIIDLLHEFTFRHVLIIIFGSQPQIRLCVIDTKFRLYGEFN